MVRKEMMEYQIIQYQNDYKKPLRKGWIIFLVILGIILLMAFINADNIKKIIKINNMTALERKNYETEKYFKIGRTPIHTGLSCVQLKIKASSIGFRDDAPKLECDLRCGKLNKNTYDYNCNGDKLFCDCK